MSRKLNTETYREIDEFRKKLIFYRGLSALSTFAMLLLLGVLLSNKHVIKSFHLVPPTHPIDLSAPHAREISAIIEPLQYSFLPILSKPNVTMTLNFLHGFWQLSNIHEFDAQGNVILAEDKYGLCGELAGYTYQKVLPLLEKEYRVRFARAAESNYFPAPLNTHFVISIVDLKNPERVFILDPSFRRYGPLDQFDDYLFFEHLASLRFMAQKDKNNIEIVNRAMPVLISNGIKLSLMAQVENNRFDPDNFSLSILGTTKNTYMPRRIYKIGLANGERFEKEHEVEGIDLSQLPEYASLKQRVREFFADIVTKKPTYKAGSRNAKSSS